MSAVAFMKNDAVFFIGAAEFFEKAFIHFQYAFVRF